MGFYLLHRGWMDDPDLQDRSPEPFTKREAWIWMVENAAFKQTRARAGLVLIDLERGQLTTSLRLLGKEWRWDHLKVRRFLDKLVVAGKIEVCRASETANETGQTVITVCNYNEFQNGYGLTKTATETPVKQQRNSDETPIKEGKEGKEGNQEKEESPPISPPRERANEPAGFAEWWQLYPHKVGKRAAMASYRSALTRTDDPIELLDGLHRYIQTKPPERAWCNPTTWLNQDRWLDQPQEVQRDNGKHHNHDDQQSLFGEQKLTGLAAVYCRLREKYDRAGMD